MNSPNKSATISVADFLFLPFFQTPLIPNSRDMYIAENNGAHFPHAPLCFCKFIFCYFTITFLTTLSARTM